MLNDKEQKIARPRQIYVGPPERPYASSLNYAAKGTPKDAVRK
jgi:hypothetical protein